MLRYCKIQIGKGVKILKEALSNIIERDKIEKLTSLIEKNYNIKVFGISPNPFNGYLGETYIVNDNYIIKRPLRGGGPESLQGNVIFSTYIMNEAKLHGIPAPLNILNLKGQPYTYDPGLGYFHVMEKMSYERCDQIDRSRLAVLLGFHSAQISVLTSNLINKYFWREADVADPWSLDASLKKLTCLFNMELKYDQDSIKSHFGNIAQKLAQQEDVPLCLVNQVKEMQPLHILEMAQLYLRTDASRSRKVIIHNDINPRNIMFRCDANERWNLDASFDYTMACIGNSAKNIANTVVDSFLGKGKSISDFEEMILCVAQGVLYGQYLAKDEIDSIKDEILAACLRKYALRWEYWKDEINGFSKNYQIEFLNPQEPFDLFVKLTEYFSNQSLCDQLYELSRKIKPTDLGLDQVTSFINSQEYWKLVRNNPGKISGMIKPVYDEAYGTLGSSISLSKRSRYEHI